MQYPRWGEQASKQPALSVYMRSTRSLTIYLVAQAENDESAEALKILLRYSGNFQLSAF